MSQDVMLALGDYRFSVETAAFQGLSRSTEYRWQQQDRFDHRPALQYTGPGADKITLKGVIYPHFKGGLGQVEAMRASAEGGEPLMLVDGLGYTHGLWCILSIKEDQSAFFFAGTPRKVEFTVELQRYGEDLYA